jgi:hypothetical protein
MMGSRLRRRIPLASSASGLPPSFRDCTMTALS